MYRSFILVILGLLSLSCASQQKWTYPFLKNDKKVESHFGISYANNFNNLENLSDPNVNRWFSLQDSLTEAYFDQDAEFKRQFLEYKTLYRRKSDPASKITFSESGDTFFLSIRNDTAQKGKVLYRQQKKREKEFIYDPKAYANSEFKVDKIYPSYDGNYLALVMKNKDLFFNHIIIVDVNSGQIMGRPVTNAKPEKAGGVIWTPDSRSILFIAYPNTEKEPNFKNGYVAQYEINNPEDSVKAVFKNGMNGIEVNDQFYPVPKFRSVKSNYVFVYLANANDYWDCYYMSKSDFTKGGTNWKLFHKVADSVLYSYGTERDHKFYFKRANKNSIQLCVVDMEHPNFADPYIIDEGLGNNQIGEFIVTKEYVYFSKVINGIESFLYRFNEKDGIEQIKLPKKAGTIDFDYRSPYNDDVWVKINGWTSGFAKYYVNPTTTEFEFQTLGSYPKYSEFDDIISEIIEVTSHDGEKVPMSIVRRRDHKMDGTSLGVIVAYGAYGFSETPYFHSPLLQFVNKGYIYATAHVRGGGEKGPAWHKAGMKSTKENSWKDLKACSDYLVQNGYINAQSLGLFVESAGGITGGMAINENPGLFGAFCAAIPTLNPIRKEYIESINDYNGVFEFGTVKVEESYNDLLKMDPVVNLSSKLDYPSTLIIMGYKDNIIHPSSPGKYIALLQEFNDFKSKKPYLLDVKFDSEHDFDWFTDFVRMLYFMEKELKRNQ